VLLGLLGFGLGLTLTRALPALPWPLALLLLGVWLGRWPRPQGWLLALVVGVVASTLARPPEPVEAARTPLVRRYASTPEQARAWAGVRTLSVRNARGGVTVTGGEPPRLRAVYERTGDTGRVPDGLLSAYAGRTLSLTGLEPAWPQSDLRGVRAELRAAVPRAVRLSVFGRIGDVRAAGLAAAHIDTNLGDVTLSSVAGASVVLTDVGDVLVTGAGGGVVVETQVGDIWLEPDASAAPILAKTDVGDIALVLPHDADVRVLATSVSRELPARMTRLSPTRGELVLGRGERLIVLETRIGEIRVVQP